MTTWPLRMSLLAAALSTSLGIQIAGADDAMTPQSDGLAATISDTAITAKVKTKMLSDDKLSTSKVSVNTTNGVVTLTGSAASANARQDAEQIAKSIDGVKSVDNELATSSTSTTATQAKRAVSDSWITTKVKSEILADSVTKGFDVSVRTSHGVVALSGTLANQDAVDHVKDIAAKVDGVKSVDVSGLKAQSG